MRLRLRQITAWVLLFAFCGMTGTKAFHHHHWQAAEDIVCPLDGVTMSHHTLAHSVLQALESDDEGNCAICQFTVTKVVIPTNLHFFSKNPKHYLHPFAITPCRILDIQGVSLLRAPPINE